MAICTGARSAQPLCRCLKNCMNVGGLMRQ